MSFDSLDRILEALEKQPGWEAHRRYRHLLQCWESVVEPKIVKQTRLLYVSRNVLFVATANAVWAQNLSLQRYSLLKKLNALLSKPLADIRFSSAQWYNVKPVVPGQETQEKHPSAIESVPSLPDFPNKTQTPQEAFQRWAAVIESRSQNWLVCPCCQCPTPPGELERWTVCAHCISKQWSSQESTSSEMNLS
jgi:predicted nucleic acid-binding Zn ribbon protein